VTENQVHTFSDSANLVIFIGSYLLNTCNVTNVLTLFNGLILKFNICFSKNKFQNVKNAQQRLDICLLKCIIKSMTRRLDPQKFGFLLRRHSNRFGTCIDSFSSTFWDLICEFQDKIC
jgi:hypothetical protein